MCYAHVASALFTSKLIPTHREINRNEVEWQGQRSAHADSAACEIQMVISDLGVGFLSETIPEGARQ